jgi:hypothetical protein
MWKEVGISLLSLLQEKVGKFILPKTRRRSIYRKRLKTIVEGFSACIDYDRTCSLISFIGETQGKIAHSSSLLIQLEKARILSKWFAFFKSRINLTYLRNTTYLFDEFGSILNKTHEIFREFCNTLDEKTIQQLKRNEHGYPTFKKIYTESTNDFEKLSQEASQKLKEFKSWHFLALPEL